MTPLSPQQQKALTVLVLTKDGRLPSDFLQCAVLGVPEREHSRWKRQRNPLTGSQRASFSRMLKRLEDRGLIERDHCVAVLTDAGRKVAVGLTFASHGIQTLTASVVDAWFVRGAEIALVELASNLRAVHTA